MRVIAFQSTGVSPVTQVLGNLHCAQALCPQEEHFNILSKATVEILFNDFCVIINVYLRSHAICIISFNIFDIHNGEKLGLSQNILSHKMETTYPNVFSFFFVF